MVSSLFVPFFRLSNRVFLAFRAKLSLLQVGASLYVIWIDFLTIRAPQLPLKFQRPVRMQTLHMLSRRCKDGE